MKTTLKRITQTAILMAAIIMFTIYGCKKVDSSNNATPDELKGYEASIKAQIAALPEREKLPAQIFNEKIPVTTFLADENNNPLPQTTSLACNFTTPTYCNLIRYTRMYDCTSTTASADGGYYMQFTYQLSWDNAIYERTSAGYLKIYNTATSALVVNETITRFNIRVIDRGADIANPGNNVYEVSFTCPTLISSAIVNGGTAYNVFTSALFGTTCANGTNYLVGSAAVTSASFTGTSGNDPCKRNDKVQCVLASSGIPNPTYAHSAGTYVYATSGACGYTSTFIIPDLVEVQYSLDGGVSFSPNMTGASGSTGNYLKYHIPGTGGAVGFTFTSAPTLTSGSYNLVFRDKNWKYGDPSRINTLPFITPSLSATPADCTNIGNGAPTPALTESGYTYYYYGNVTIP